MSNAKKILIGSLWIAAACSVLGFVTLSREQSKRQSHVPANLSADQPIVIDEKGIPLDPDTLPVLFPAPEFSLIDADENEFKSSHLDGQVYIARFFFSSCPGVCPMMSRRVTDLQKTVTDERVKFVSFTVDPETDTPAVLREYRDKVWSLDKSRNIFLTGSIDQMRKLPSDFHFIEITKPEDHVAKLILIDRAGNVRGLYSTELDADMNQLKIDVRKVLEEKP